ncbi:unnamed protein product [Paramecium primaurelia]|uniref:Uncharacterized protein n=1 Tax=Paramecium primaurelia TaxID=5886 RepID=A0A8S1M3H5_PARPR|nr:unnamed protein product [Paramecium primaurelia]
MTRDFVKISQVIQLKDYCKLNSVADVSGACQIRTCYDNEPAQSDQVTDALQETIEELNHNMKPLNNFFHQTRYYTLLNLLRILCSGDATNTEISKCKDRKCSDNTITISNDECQVYLNDCVIKGIVCVENKTLIVQHTKEQVDNITETSSCQQKKQSDITGTDDNICSDGMKGTYNKDDTYSFSNILQITGHARQPLLEVVPKEFVQQLQIPIKMTRNAKIYFNTGYHQQYMKFKTKSIQKQVMYDQQCEIYLQLNTHKQFNYSYIITRQSRFFSFIRVSSIHTIDYRNMLKLQLDCAY